MSDLKPCPFCGGEVVREATGVGQITEVSCGECGRCLQISDEEWNRRPIEDALRAELVLAKEALRRADQANWESPCGHPIEDALRAELAEAKGKIKQLKAIHEAELQAAPYGLGE